MTTTRERHEVEPYEAGRHQVAMPPEKNPWERYADDVQGNRIIGEMLKFSKGEWNVGRDMIEVKPGTRLIAGIDSMQIGWMKWVDGKPADTRMGYLRDDYKVARRTELPDTDREEWPADDRNGQPRDPWQFSNRFILFDPKVKQLFTFPTQSAGGVDACGNLAALYGKHVRAKPRELPVVALERSSYMHPNREFGKIYKPVFKLVGWIDRASFDAALAADAEAALADDAGDGEAEAERAAAVHAAHAADERRSPKSYAEAKGKRGAPRGGQAREAAADEDIPF